MVCHECERPASARCVQCHRYMCNGHTDQSTLGEEIQCTACTKQEGTEKEQREARQRADRERPRPQCAFCGYMEPYFNRTTGEGYVVEGYRLELLDPGSQRRSDGATTGSLEKCGSCGERFCPRCGVITVLGSCGDVDRPGSRVYIWTRCNGHPLQKKNRSALRVMFTMSAESPAFWTDEPPDREHSYD